MKKLYVLLIPLLALILFLGTGLMVHADGAGDYTLTEDEGLYTLVSPIGEAVASESPGELIAALPGGARLRVLGVSIEEPINVKRSVTLSGMLSLSAPITVRGGARLTLDGITLSLTGDGVLEVYDGCAALLSGLITHTDGTAVSARGLSSSLFVMTGGRVSTRSSSPAISLLRGTAELLGGYVDNPSGVAVHAEGTLTVGGSLVLDSAAFDITSSGDVCLSPEHPFGGTLSVKLLREFADGGLYPVILGAMAGSSGSFSVYDALGAPHKLTYFDNGGDGYLAVYLPYTVSYVADGRTVYTDELLSGMTPTKHPLPPRQGYNAGAWCTDSTLTEEYNFAAPVLSDITLYASYSLSAPAFSLQSAETVYDGREHSINFSKLSHPLESEGFYSFIWERESGEILGYTSSLSFRNVADSGRYRCIITFTVGRDTVTVATPYITVNVKKQILTPPECKSSVYTSGELVPRIAESPLYTFPYSSYIDVGEYIIPVTLTDPENYEWIGWEGDTASVSFNVLKAENSWLREPDGESVFFGEEIGLVGDALFGDVTYRFSGQGMDDYDTRIPTAIGIYYVIAEVAESENYTGLTSEPFIIEIREDMPVALSVNTPPDVTEYRAFDYFLRDGLTLLVTYESGRYEIIDASSVSVLYQTDSCLRYGDTGVTVEYRGVRLSVPLRVVKREYDINFTPEDVFVIYDGTYRTYDVNFTPPVGLDGIQLSASVTGGGSDAGVYGIEIRFFTDSLDYSPPAPLYPRLIIEPREVSVVWDRTEFVYNGTVICPRAEFTDVFGASVPLLVTGGAIMAKDGYVAVATTNNTNYSLQNPTVGFSISRAELDLSGVYLSDNSFVYDGTVKSVTLLGLPSGVGVVGYTDNSGCDAGEYTLSAVLSYDSANYNAPAPLELTWYIERAPYSTEGFSFLPGEYVYDGAPHFPTLVGNMPTGLDGIPLVFTFGDGVTDCRSSSVVEVIFSTESENYYPPAKLYVPVRVTPRGFYVVWYGTDFVYDGTEHSPRAIGEYPAYVIGSGVNAGNYTARAVSESDNYYVINSEASFTVNKRANILTSPITVSDVFVGTPPSPEASLEYGAPIFIYYRDAALTAEVTPSSPGLYYAIAYAPESENYLPFFSDAVTFSVVAVVPVRLDVTMIRNVFSAFDRVAPDDFLAKVTYNDGTSVTLDSREVAVLYDEGNCLLFGNGGVTFTCLGVGTSAPVTVEKIRYDMSGVVWSDTKAVYDGSPKLPTLSGLPEGITLLSMLGGGVNAGSYSVTATLAYDERNYEPPTLPAVPFVIEKQRITPTLAGTLTYNGEPQLPTSASPLFYVVPDGEYRDAGSYSVLFALTDPENYEFIGDGRVDFVILPSDITVLLADEDVYLFEEPKGNGYAVTEGVYRDGDDLQISYSVMDGRLYAASGNGNYKVTVIPGNINYLHRPSPAVGRALFFCFLLAVILMLLLVLAARRRDDIRVLLLSVKERYLAAPRVPAALPTPSEIPSGGVDVSRADGLISDGIAKTLIRREGAKIYTQGRRRAIINVDTLSESFAAGDRVDINVLKEKGLVPDDAGYLKVLARGAVDKPLRIYANAFSLSAVKMIALTGGEANKVTTGREKREI